MFEYMGFQTVLFGEYEQDNNTENGKEPIEWLVIENNDKKCVLISAYVLDTVEITSKKWKTSPIRKFLNNDFYNNAFNDEEKKAFIELTSQNGETDNISLLPIEKIDSAFLGYAGIETNTIATPFARQKGLEIRLETEEINFYNSNTGSSEWLSVSDDGFVNEKSEKKTHGLVGIRPIISIDTEIANIQVNDVVDYNTLLTTEKDTRKLLYKMYHEENWGYDLVYSFAEKNGGSSTTYWHFVDFDRMVITERSHYSGHYGVTKDNIKSYKIYETEDGGWEKEGGISTYKMSELNGEKVVNVFDSSHNHTDTYKAETITKYQIDIFKEYINGRSVDNAAYIFFHEE